MSGPKSDARAESIRQRLRNELRARGEDVALGLQRYAVERFLYRLGRSDHRKRFVLKGATLFAIWGTAYRPTRDIDFTGYGSPESPDVIAAFREICATPDDVDQLVFDLDGISAEPIRDGSEYPGLRIRIRAQLGGSDISLQVDVGFGNAIVPAPEETEYRTILGDPPPRILAYPRESVVAEKLHALVTLGERNSRYKDFYDLHALAGAFAFERTTLAHAVSMTFQRRATPIGGELPVALTGPVLFQRLPRTAVAGVHASQRAFRGPAGLRARWRAAHPLLATDLERRRVAGDASRRLGAGRSVAMSAQRRFKPYPAYKDSGIEWLGEIPVDWQAVGLKRLVDPARPVTYGIVQCGLDYPNGVPYIRPVDMDDEGGVEASALQRTSPEIAAAYRRSTVRSGDIVVSIGPSFGKAMIVPAELDGANLTQGTARIAPGPGVISRFFFWILRSRPSFMAWDSFCSGATFRALTLEILETCEVALPSPAEQRAITAFLDRETARIDALVAKKERLIELLQEKRTALITHVVTKGIDPTVPMKESGIEWLGEIPAHWEVERIKWAAQMVSGHTPDKKVDSYWQGGDIPWLSLADTGQLREVDYIADTAVMTTSDGIANSSAHVLPEGTVVFSRDATIGLCAVTRAGMAVSQHFIGWVCRSRLRPEYLLLVLRSMTQELERLTMGATIRTIGMPDVKSLVTPIPPLAEQETIVREVLKHRAHIDALIAKVRDAIDRLKELRTALISAAVTGKIDVREEVA